MIKFEILFHFIFRSLFICHLNSFFFGFYRIRDVFLGFNSIFVMLSFFTEKQNENLIYNGSFYLKKFHFQFNKLAFSYICT